MSDKFEVLFSGGIWNRIDPKHQTLIRNLAKTSRLTFQETRQLILIVRDWEQWDIKDIGTRLSINNSKAKDKKDFLNITAQYERERKEPFEYNPDGNHTLLEVPKQPVTFIDQGKLLGKCPVASDKTRCCNLDTLDVVMGCGFGCHYCSIQSFYEPDKIRIRGDLKERLSNLEITPETSYHIGTGQGSDSLLYGNRDNILQNLSAFAEEHPNVILELKSKSDNISWFLENSVPKNMILTWSINTPAVITHEEPGTASLEKRLAAARNIADKGILIGFHFHPIIDYRGGDIEYQKTSERIKTLFQPEEIVMISLGTLTYSKKALKIIRESDSITKVLQMPLTEIGGKYSYPKDTKERLFGNVLKVFNEWNDQVYFYLCMEDKEIWKPVLGREYINNEEFEKDMMLQYFKKIQASRDRSKS